MSPHARIRVVLTVLVALAATQGGARTRPSVVGRAHGLPAQVLAAARQVRARGCAGRAAIQAGLRVSHRLVAAARALATGVPLAEALTAAGYPATLAVQLHLSGALTSRSIARYLTTRLCSRLTDAALRDAGVYARADNVWLIVASPRKRPALADAPRIAERVLQLVNAARAAGRRCGPRVYAPAAPLSRSVRLRHAALAHARDMASRGTLSHIGRDGSTVGERVTQSGFLWSEVGENIASGQTSAAQVVRAWLASPPHCANIMNPAFTATAVAFSTGPHAASRVYWTEDFARPRSARRR